MKAVCKVRGMSCSACSASVEKTLNNLNGVKQASVSLASEEALLEFDESIISESEIEKAVSDSGYRIIFPDRSSEEDNLLSEKKQQKQLITNIIFTSVLFVICFGPMLFDGFYKFNPVFQLILCIPVLICGRKFFINGFRALFKGHPNMDSLVATGSTASFVYSLFNLVNNRPNLYFDGVAMIITLVMVGKNIELKSRRKAGDSIKSLMNLAPSKATLIKDGVQYVVDVNQIKPGDTVLVHPGEKVSADGTIIEGTGCIDESMLTGESLPSVKSTGEKVFGATLNTSGSFTFTAEKTGDETFLASVIRMVKQAQNSKAPIARIADKVAGVFVPVVMSISLCVFIAWMITGKDLSFAVQSAVSVLVVACPCSLGLATPIAIMVSTGKAAENGILFSDAQAIENLGKMQNVMFDKTGTLTKGLSRVSFYTDRKTLELAAVCEQTSEHPFAKAVLDEYKDTPLQGRAFNNIPGKGVTCRCDLGKIIAGNRTMMEEYDIVLPNDVPDAQIYVSLNGEYAGCVGISDEIREEAHKAVDSLKALGLKVAMLTGDNEQEANRIAGLAGIQDVHCALLPADKLSIVDSAEQSVMVGDGINDAPSLEKADIGIAMGNGTDVAMQSADVVIVNNNLMNIEKAVRLSRATIKNIKLSLFWAFFYNTLSIPVAAGVLTLFGGPSLSPMLCALCMSLSSLSVVSNALRLRKFN